ncbi:MAG: response regulator transcription factor [Gemmatimonadaceae bacterium]
MIDAERGLTSKPSSSPEGDRNHRLLILSDMRIVREGLAFALTERSRTWNVTAVATLRALLTDLAAESAGVVLLDMSMTNALACARSISLEAPGSAVVGFAAENADATLIACVECGIVGFVPREGSLSDLVSTIEGALCGEAKLSPSLTITLMRRLASLERQRVLTDTNTNLTQREEEILAMLGEGLSNKEIAARLNIEVATVKNHVHNILSKTQLRRRSEAAALLHRRPRVR